MPIYDHLCDHCGHAFSVVRSFKDPPVEHCPSCGKRPRRLITPPAIVFKGSGWYKTDSRASSSAAKDATSSDGGEAKGEKPAGKTSEKNAEKKAEKKAETGVSASGGEAAS